MSVNGGLDPDHWKMRNQGSRILLTFVDLIFVRAEDIQTKWVLHLLHDLASLTVIRLYDGEERPKDFL